MDFLNEQLLRSYRRHNVGLSRLKWKHLELTKCSKWRYCKHFCKDHFIKRWKQLLKVTRCWNSWTSAQLGFVHNFQVGTGVRQLKKPSLVKPNYYRFQMQCCIGSQVLADVQRLVGLDLIFATTGCVWQPFVDVTSFLLTKCWVTTLRANRVNGTASFHMGLVVLQGQCTSQTSVTQSRCLPNLFLCCVLAYTTKLGSTSEPLARCTEAHRVVDILINAGLDGSLHEAVSDAKGGPLVVATSLDSRAGCTLPVNQAHVCVCLTPKDTLTVWRDAKGPVKAAISAEPGAFERFKPRQTAVSHRMLPAQRNAGDES